MSLLTKSDFDPDNRRALRNADTVLALGAHDPCACMIGTLRSVIENGCDSLYGLPVSLHLFLPCTACEERTVRLRIGSEDTGIYFYAANEQVKSACVCGGEERELYGVGRLRQYRGRCAPVTREASYTVTLRSCDTGMQMRIRITATGFTYDSGLLTANDSSTLCMGTCTA